MTFKGNMNTEVEQCSRTHLKVDSLSWARSLPPHLRFCTRECVGGGLLLAGVSVLFRLLTVRTNHESPASGILGPFLALGRGCLLNQYSCEKGSLPSTPGFSEKSKTRSTMPHPLSLSLSLCCRGCEEAHPRNPQTSGLVTLSKRPQIPRPSLPLSFAAALTMCWTL